MVKPRVIIADTDHNYIIPLQLKFVEDYFEEVDLEIITDAACFQTAFSTPQRADVLIISEDLYSLAIRRHNIAHIFLMTERYEEEQTEDLNLTRIFKYTSIKEIFNEITGKSANVFKSKKATTQQTQVVLVYSASGGTGKTTLAMGVSASLTKNYKKVLYLNAERLQSFQYLLDNPSSVASAEVYAKLTNPTESIYADIKHVIRKELFSYLPPFKAALLSLGFRYSIFLEIVKAAKKSGDFDFIVVDADITFDEDKADLINFADKVLVVANQSLASVTATNVLVSNVNGMNSDKYIFICNDFVKEDPNALISPNTTLKFTVSDYVDHFRYYEQMKLDDFSKESSIQRVAFLIM